MFKLRVEDTSEWSVDKIPVWNIYRRYSDFLELFYAVRKAFPAVVLDMPPRRWMGNKFDPSFLGKRLQGLDIESDN